MVSEGVIIGIIVVVVVIIAIVAIILLRKKPAPPAPTPTNVSASYTAPSQPSQPYTYLGCYADCPGGNCNLRVEPNQGDNSNVQECYNYAKSQGATYFGLEYAEGIGNGLAECWVGNNSNYSEFGPTSTCTNRDANGELMGSAGSIAMYQIA